MAATLFGTANTTWCGSRETATWSDLFKGIYLKRTLTAWMLGFCTSFIGYGLVLWMPTIARTVYNLPVAEALRFGVIINVVGLAGPIVCLLLIDFIGRKASFLIAFLGGFVGMFALWLIGDTRTATQVITLGTLSYFFIGFLLTGLYVYIPETYPTRMRALGTGSHRNTEVHRVSPDFPRVVGSCSAPCLGPLELFTVQRLPFLP